MTSAESRAAELCYAVSMVVVWWKWYSETYLGVSIFLLCSSADMLAVVAVAVVQGVGWFAYKFTRLGEMVLTAR